MTHVKDKKITIQTYTEAQDENGDLVKTWTPLAGAENIWAYYRHLSGKEYWGSQKLNSMEEVVFEINWRNDLDTTMQVVYNGKAYQITWIDDFEGNKDNIKIYANIVK